MNKIALLPKLTVNAIKKNGSSYVPYMLVSTFSVFVFFIFSAICDHKMMYDLPHAGYVIMLMEIGRVILGIILAPVLIGANSFLVKQRKNELGLYSVLGLDQKYISVIMFIETLIIYSVTVGAGIIIGTVFSKLIYLLLLNITRLPIDVSFTASFRSYKITLLYFAGVAIFNFIFSLLQVCMARPIEMMKSSKKGEKPIRFLGLKTFVGLVILGFGYYIALTTKLDSMIFTNFFLAVVLVVVGTRVIFKSGTISVLQKMKQTPKIYYKKHNFVTISGMLYRMKRNAQGLSNICIFSTMIIITLICTISLFTGQDEAIGFNYPLDATYKFETPYFKDGKPLNEELKRLAKEHNIELKNKKDFSYKQTKALKKGNAFSKITSKDIYSSETFKIYFLALEDYNRIENKQETLMPGEAFIFSTSKDFNASEVVIENKSYKVKKELSALSFESKEARNIVNRAYYIILPKLGEIDALSEMLKMEGREDAFSTVRFDLVGEEKNKDAFIEAVNAWVKRVPGFHSYAYIGDWARDSHSMNGGLLFLGIFFGIVFSVCLVLMMYYKQLSEGFEDKRNFEILQQVGMSDEEVRGTIRKQILTVFFLPLVVAVVHTFVGLQIVKNLLGVLNLYNDYLILGCSGLAILCFIVIYIISYSFTGKAYYKIVK